MFMTSKKISHALNFVALKIPALAREKLEF